MIAAGTDIKSTCVDANFVESTISLELKAGLSAPELERRIAQANRAGDIGARALAFYLVDMADRGTQQELGFHSVVQYAETRFGIQPSTTREYLAAGRALEDLPLIDDAFCEARLFWSQVRLLVRIATPETQAVWIEWAAGRTARQIAAQIRNRDKGDLPTDPARRRIHTTKFKVQGSFNVVELEMWNAARAKIEAETGAPVSDSEMMKQAARLLLDTRADGSVPGRTPVNDSHFKVVVHCPAAGGPAEIHTEDGPVALDDRTARNILHEAGRDDLAEALDEDDEGENSGPEVPVAERDRPTPSAMLAEVLARDGYRCLCCQARKSPSGHHKKFRRYGGPTVPVNLMTLCDDCHSLVHDDLLVVRGRIPDGLRFTDRHGRDIRELGDTIQAALARLRRDARASSARRVGFRDLPRRADPGWWARHEHLLDFNESQGSLEFRPGVPLESPPKEEQEQEVQEQGDARAARPRLLADIIGQKNVVRNLRRAVTAAKRLGEPVRHTLLYGPAGLGKTTLARAVANEMGTTCRRVSGPVVKELGGMLGLLTSLRDGDILFLDEVHRLPARIAEFLYEAMEDGEVSLPVSCGIQRKTLHVRLNRFTVIGATTDEDLLPPSFRERFGIRQHLEFYGPEELTELLLRAATGAGLDLETEAARMLALVSRDTPREALELLWSVRDEQVLLGGSKVQRQTVARVLEELGIDELGLRPFDRRYLNALREARGALGLSTLAARLGSSRQALEQVHEPYLIRRGLVSITRDGRVLSSRC
ncbi:MAG: Holliday junction branch migration DNA helicase RuvB [Planctomycetota bacterium]|jgi:Holliday junction DNA helicase RuvB